MRAKRTISTLCRLMAIIALALWQSGARAQGGDTITIETKKDGNVTVYLPKTVNPKVLSRIPSQTVEVRGIIGSYDKIKEQYRFQTDDGYAIWVVGNFPNMGGVAYWLRARVIQKDGKTALSEVRKWPVVAAPPGIFGLGKNAPLIIGGGVLILAALAILGMMMSRNKAEERRRQEEDIRREEEERRRQEDERRQREMDMAKGNKNKGGTVVSGGENGGGSPHTIVSVGHIKVTSGPHANQTFPLVAGETRIGRKKDNGVAVVLDKDGEISSYHGSVIATLDGRVIYKDASSNGSVVDGQAVHHSQTEIKPGTEIEIGATTFQVTLRQGASPSASSSAAPVSAPADPRQAATVNVPSPFAAAPAPAAPTSVGYGAELEVVDGPDAGKRFPITKATTTLGREGRDILFKDGSVSRQHATLAVQNGEFRLRDDKSAHGTTVNDEPVDGEGRVLNNGDRITLGGGKTTLVFNRVGG